MLSIDDKNLNDAFFGMKMIYWDSDLNLTLCMLDLSMLKIVSCFTDPILDIIDLLQQNGIFKCSLAGLGGVLYNFLPVHSCNDIKRWRMYTNLIIVFAKVNVCFLRFKLGRLLKHEV